MLRILGRTCWILALAFGSTTAIAGDGPLMFAAECETALALSAVPERLRTDAAVYHWSDGDYRIGAAENADAHLHCFVARNHPRSVIPVCFTRSGVESVMQGVVYRSQLAMEGKMPDEQDAAFNKKVATGEFVAPEGPGINYMMSGYTRIYQREQDEFWSVPPHAMYFAPGVVADEVGSATMQEAMQQPGLPVVIDSGIHAYIVTFVENSSEGSEVVATCPDSVLQELTGEMQR